MSNAALGVVGLGVMGRNLALNVEDHGFAVAAWDAWPEPVDEFAAQTEGIDVTAFRDLGDFVGALARPRRILMMVKAGKIVDETIARIAPLLEPGDLLIDGGNEYFENTERRARELAAKELRFFGMGVSGGEHGARHGPSMMPGGDRKAYDDLAPVLTKIAAQVSDGPCVTYCGPGGAGHYVKMVHNGIEYGDMQLIAEAYDVLKTLGGLGNAELADAFDEWNAGELESFLIEITAKIFRKKDPETGGDLIDAIRDTASMKGTGKWTVQDAQSVGVPVPTIAASVDARVLSSAYDRRQRAAEMLRGPVPGRADAIDAKALIDDVRAALYAAKTQSYAQGMQLIRAASDERGWGVDLSEIARIWKAGCIIRAGFLGRIQAAYQRDPELESLLFDPEFVQELAARQDGWRRVVTLAVDNGLPVPGLAGSLGYYDSTRRARLPANLVQAQRDFFGAHTYQRLDREGSFHTEWDA